MQSYDLIKLQELLKDFHNLTGMKICIHDSAGNELCYYPEKLSAFCALLRTDPALDERCRKCDEKAFSECKKTRRQYFYTCHAGLKECVSPILYEGKIIGYIILGQIKTDEGQGFDAISGNFPEEMREALSEKFYSLRSETADKINSAMHILDACTGYEYLKNLVRSAENRIDVLLDDYVSENIEDDLSVQTMCSAFRLSHSEIYEVFRKYFDSTPAEYVKDRRLRLACDLLCGTSLPINKVGKKCGIGDYNYFSKIFKRKFGVSPREYRRSRG